MTDRAPRPEGMSDEEFRPWLVRQIRACDEQMRAAKHQTKRARFADSALLLQGILQEFDRRQSGEVSPLSEVMTDRFAMDDAKVQAYAKLELSDEAISRGWINWSDTAILACREIARLRADGATLKVRSDEALAAHSASFGALQTLSAALFDGEVDDYAALAEKIIARVRQLESDGATLRERVEELERRSGVMNVCVVCKQRKPVCCGFDESARDLHDPMHPDRDFPSPSWCADCCQKHKPATTPKEPESKRCSHCGCEWRGTPPTPDECPSCGATL